MPPTNQQAKDLTLEHLDPNYAVNLLRRLVGADSENPPGNERNMAACLQSVVGELGLDLEIVEVKPGRPSAVAVLKGATGSPTLVFNGHMDTVPIGDAKDWSVNPFAGEEKGGRLYGRGSADMKGGIAAFITAVKALRDAGIQLKGNIILQFAMGEETSEPGTKSLVGKGYVGEYGIVAEPTGLRVATACRGLLWLKVILYGRAAHAGTPQMGINAIELAAKAIELLGKYQASLRSKSHPLAGSPGCVVTMIQGGHKENVVPDRCELIVDRRMIPGERPEEVQREFEESLSALRLGDPNARYEVELLRVYESTEIDPEAPIAQVLRHNLKTLLGRESPPWGTPYGADTRNLVNEGHMQAVTFGPGFIENAHCVDESIEIQQLVDAARVFACTAVDLLGLA